MSQATLRLTRHCGIIRSFKIGLEAEINHTVSHGGIFLYLALIYAFDSFWLEKYLNLKMLCESQILYIFSVLNTHIPTFAFLLAPQTPAHLYTQEEAALKRHLTTDTSDHMNAHYLLLFFK